MKNRSTSVRLGETTADDDRRPRERLSTARVRSVACKQYLKTTLTLSGDTSVELLTIVHVPRLSAANGRGSVYRRARAERDSREARSSAVIRAMTRTLALGGKYAVRRRSRARRYHQGGRRFDFDLLWARQSA